MTSPVVLALLAAVGFGCAGIFIRRALSYASPLAAAMVSVAVTTVLVCLLAAATAPVSQMFTWRIMAFVAAGFLAPGLARLAMFTGIHRIGVARAMPVVSTTPGLAVLVAIAALGERPSAWLLVGVICIVGGGVLLAGGGKAEGAWRSRDLAFPLLAALGFALRDNIFRLGFRHYDDPTLAAAAAALASLAVMGTVTFLQRGSGLIRIERAAFPFLAASGLAEACGYLTALRAFQGGDVSVVSPLVSTYGLVALVLAALFLRDLERVSLRVVLAAALIVSGVFVVMRSVSA